MNVNINISINIRININISIGAWISIPDVIIITIRCNLGSSVVPVGPRELNWPTSLRDRCYYEKNKSIIPSKDQLRSSSPVKVSDDYQFR